MKFWPLQDTIARRFACTIVFTIVLMVSLTWLVVQFAGVWARPSAHEMGLLDRANDIVRMIEAVSPTQRSQVAGAAANTVFRVDWYPERSRVAVALDAAASVNSTIGLETFGHDARPRRTVRFQADQRDAPLPPPQVDGRPDRGAYFLSVELEDRSWVMFTAFNRIWGVDRSTRISVALGLLVVSITGVSIIATHRMTKPIKVFTDAMRRFGTDPRASLVPETGPQELRLSIRTFNAMQAQIQRFVDDRTTMLAAISHDLRTPLTKMRLRGEFIENEEQKRRLFRDVDDMQAMVEGALTFFRDDIQQEERTAFDFPELLQTLADDYSDQGHVVSYAGVAHLRFLGRPFALKRALSNLVDNAVKYGTCAQIELRRQVHQIQVVVQDSGPGIPIEAAERVFSPFYRLETSRSRTTGGVGLGLTSARAVIRAHGGDIRVANLTAGGLAVTVSLPLEAGSSAERGRRGTAEEAGTDPASALRLRRISG